MFRPVSRRTHRRRVEREFRNRIHAIAEILRTKYPPKSSSSSSATGSSTSTQSIDAPTSSGHNPLFNTPRRTGRPGPQHHRRRGWANMRQGMRWMMHAIAMLIVQVLELRQQHAAMMDLLQGRRGMSSSPCESSGFNLRPVATPDQLDALANALDDDTYRHQLVTYLCSLGGDTVVSFIDRVFGALFSEEITSFVTFYGRQGGKRPFFGTPLYNLVLDSQNTNGEAGPSTQP
nr:unnamed protein product [Spirometra erinaceieuropaei]